MPAGSLPADRGYHLRVFSDAAFKKEESTGHCGERSTCYAVAVRIPTSRRPALATRWTSSRASNGVWSGPPS
eukprot:4617996-Alexandrium_andersonii.AAC.1